MNTQKILDILKEDAFIQKILVLVASLTAATAITFLIPLQAYNSFLKLCYDNRWYAVACLCILLSSWLFIALQKLISSKTTTSEKPKQPSKVSVDSSKTLEELNILKDEHIALQQRFDNLQYSYNELNARHMSAEADCKKKLYDQRNDFEVEMLVKERDFQKFLEDKLRDTHFEESKLFLARAVELCESFAVMHVLVEKCVVQLFIKLEYDGYEYNSEKTFREALTFARQTNDFAELIADLGRKFKGPSFPDFEKIMSKIAKIQNIKFKDEKLVEVMQYFDVPTRTASIHFNETAVLQYLDGLDEILNLYDALKEDFNDVVREVSRSDKPKFNIPIITEAESSGEYDSPNEIDDETDEQIMSSLTQSATTTSETSAESPLEEDEQNDQKEIDNVKKTDKDDQEFSEDQIKVEEDDDLNVPIQKEQDFDIDVDDDTPHEATEQPSNEDRQDHQDRTSEDDLNNQSRKELLDKLTQENAELLSQETPTDVKDETDVQKQLQKESLLGRPIRRMSKLKKEVLEESKRAASNESKAPTEQDAEENTDTAENDHTKTTTDDSTEKPQLEPPQAEEQKPRPKFKFKFNQKSKQQQDANETQKQPKKVSIVDFEEKDEIDDESSLPTESATEQQDSSEKKKASPPKRERTKLNFQKKRLKKTTDDSTEDGAE